MGNARGAARGVGRGLAEVGRPGDVEVDPWAGHELAQEQAALDQRSLRAARVLEVAVPALHLRHVVVYQRDLPVALARARTGGDDVVVPTLLLAEGAGDLVAERAGDGAGQRGDVDEVG